VKDVETPVKALLDKRKKAAKAAAEAQRPERVAERAKAALEAKRQAAAAQFVKDIQTPVQTAAEKRKKAAKAAAEAQRAAAANQFAKDIQTPVQAAAEAAEAQAKLVQPAVEKLDGLRSTLGSDHADTLAAVNELANAYRQHQNYEAALPLAEEATATWRRTHGDDHEKVRTKH
jgi:5'-deoxynucleotidase YfbR-like HD superfamily hydrolase